MIAAVDLDQFAKASPATPWLLNLWRPKSPWQPQSAGDHQRSHGLDRQVHAMTFSELLNALEPIQFAHRHGPRWHPDHGQCPIP